MARPMWAAAGLSREAKQRHKLSPSLDRSTATRCSAERESTSPFVQNVVLREPKAAV